MRTGTPGARMSSAPRLRIDTERRGRRSIARVRRSLVFYQVRSEDVWCITSEPVSTENRCGALLHGSTGA
ncbi:hypothetical protein GOAMI_26_00100 [Gordonia amicalis NBRC 100051 = JCM 11271]|nr:hypothetical protein GOAMI_26_00100 [Gordonia amicalis NBRC 100051 = JCM 11271]